MKFKSLLIITLTIICLKSYSQSNFRRWSVGLHVGQTIDNMDFRYDNVTGSNTKAHKNFWTNKATVFGFETNYYVTPHISFGLDLTKGNLKNGVDSYHRTYKANFFSAEVRGEVLVAQFFKYDVDNWLLLFKNFYFGGGIGYVAGENNVKDFNPNIPGYPYAGTENPVGNPLQYRQHTEDLAVGPSFSTLTVPMLVGYNINFFDDYDEIRHVISLSYKTNFTFTDNINGYADDNRSSSNFQNVFKDTYSSVNVCYRYHFGAFGTYYKPVRNFF